MTKKNVNLDWEMNIRLSSSEDLDQILRLNIKEYWSEFNEWEESTLTQKIEKAAWWGSLSSLKWHYNILTRSNGGIIVYEENGNILAELDFVISKDFHQNRKIKRAHIIWILVNKLNRRNKIALKMIDFLKSLVKTKKVSEIWVEAEDIRSNQLYRKLGNNSLKIMNLTFDTINFGQDLDTKLDEKILVDITALDKQLIDKTNGQYEILVGRYFAPNYDLNQLIYAEPVYEFIWGNSPEAKVVHYKSENMDIIAILTQYPRIYVKSLPKPYDLKLILFDIITKITEIGFNQIHFQIFDNITLTQILIDLGFQLEENDDYTYIIDIS